jgi:hypothetical protein
MPTSAKRRCAHGSSHLCRLICNTSVIIFIREILVKYFGIAIAGRLHAWTVNY